MKRALLIIAVAASATTHAQITVTNQWIATLGDTVILSEDTVHASLLDLGSPAGDQHWDFTILEEHKPDGAILEAPSTAPLYTNFPTATFVVNDLTEDSIHLFFRQTSTSLDVVGRVQYDSTGQPVIAEPDFGWRYMQFPATMGSTFMSSSYFGSQVTYLGMDPDSLGPHPTIDSLRSRFYFEFHSEIDAWGEVEFSHGTYLAVRQHVWNRLKISGDWYGNGTWQPYSPVILMFLDSVMYDTAAEATYRWWSDNPAANFRIVEIETDSTGQPFESVSYIKAAPEPYLGVDEQTHTGFAIYPNPASENLTVETNTPAGWNIRLYDIQARKALEQQMTGTRVVVDVSRLKPGAYLMQITDNRGHVVRMEKIQVAH